MKRDDMSERPRRGVAVTANGSAGHGLPARGIANELATVVGSLERVDIDLMSMAEAGLVLDLLGRAKGIVDSKMCDVARMVSETDPTADPADVLREGARLPGRESRKMSKMARHLSEMPDVREKFSSGDLTPAHVNALANAAERVGPEAVNGDQTLLEAADRLSADSFERHARRWAERKLIEAGVDPLERQKQAREAKTWVEAETGLGVLMAKLPRPQFHQIRQAMDTRYLELWRRDGADGRHPDTVRTSSQRRADALVELLTGLDALTGEPIPETPGMKAKSYTQLIITVPIGVVDGTDPGGPVEIIGVGPVPADILRTFTPDTRIAGMIFDKMGRPLWLGRNQRLANTAQRLAVAVRDGGCFQCGAPMHQCELHHIREWHRDQGPTDIDNLVAVCRRHHTWLETENLVVVPTPAGYTVRSRDGPPP